MTAGWPGDLLVGIPLLAGGLCFLVTAVAMARSGDALTRINVLSVATGLGMTLFIVAALAHVTRTSGFTLTGVGEAAVAIAATIFVTTIASMTLARAAYRSTARHDPAMLYDDLARDD